MTVFSLQESKKFMASSEREAHQKVEGFKQSHRVKRSSVTKKTKKGVDYWIVDVVLEIAAEKDVYDIHFAQE